MATVLIVVCPETQYIAIPGSVTVTFLPKKEKENKYWRMLESIFLISPRNKSKYQSLLSH